MQMPPNASTPAQRLAGSLRRLSSVRNSMHPTHRAAVGNTMGSVLAILMSQAKLIADLRANCPPANNRGARGTPPRPVKRFLGRPPRPGRPTARRL